MIQVSTIVVTSRVENHACKEKMIVGRCVTDEHMSRAMRVHARLRFVREGTKSQQRQGVVALTYFRNWGEMHGVLYRSEMFLNAQRILPRQARGVQ